MLSSTTQRYSSRPSMHKETSVLERSRYATTQLYVLECLATTHAVQYTHLRHSSVVPFLAQTSLMEGRQDTSVGPVPNAGSSVNPLAAKTINVIRGMERNPNDMAVFIPLHEWACPGAHSQMSAWAGLRWRDPDTSNHRYYTLRI